MIGTIQCVHGVNMNGLQADESSLLVDLEPVGLLPCPPFQLLSVESRMLHVQAISADLDVVLPESYPNSSAALDQQRSGQGPFWQDITLHRSFGIRLWGTLAADSLFTEQPASAPLRRLLNAHPAEQLSIVGSPTMELGFYDRTGQDDKSIYWGYEYGETDDVSEADRAAADAMLRSRITS